MNPDPKSISGLPDRAENASSASGEGEIGDVCDRRCGELANVRSQPLSDVLHTIAIDTTRDGIAINDLITVLGGRGRAGLILLFSLPNVLPAPPGVSGLLGLPLLYLSFQMMMGRTPWLPQFIGRRSMELDRFAALIAAVSPWLARAERLLRPRWFWVVGQRSERGIGALCLMLACVLALPIPFGNMLPAFALCLISLGMLERDGLWVLIGTATGFLSLFIVAGVVYALFKSTMFLLINAVG